MDYMTYKGYHGSCDTDMAQEVCRGKILFIDDLVTYKADSAKELRTAFHEAVDDYIETCKLVGKEPQKPLKGQFNVRIPKELHREAYLRSIQDDVSLNEVVARSMRAYLHGNLEVVHNHKHNVSVTMGSREDSQWQTGQTTTAKDLDWTGEHHAKH
ncbi:hypothetical protein BJI67_04820 [Acidihalobacter aeolianus]|uniref:Toxin-antitoxin system HicB family antitoxin n=1 Tax=Acidihalobacter aeolianus TaxID=2792603 RepID=A0A1D8K6A7_9GAMM|nr:type II toxin-antitoxin system HicB family antitoxin [Acidihalobacter aeolianus]AOV16484.1 hypothetical protein BJI67_04820 [Acidihalobacter aeolianus]